MAILSCRCLAWVALFGLIFAPQETESKPTELKVWLEGTGRSPFDFDASVFTGSTFQSAILGHLLYRDKDFKLKEGLLRSWHWDFKTKTYVLELQPNLHFHNGRKVTAADLEFSLLRGFFSKTPSFFNTTFTNLKGIEKIKPGMRYQSGLVSGIRILDENRLEIHLTHPNPSFLHNLTYSDFSLRPFEALRDDLIQWKKLPVGAGPYRVVGYQGKTHVTKLEKVNRKVGMSPDVIEIATSGPMENSDLILWTSPPVNVKGLKSEMGPIGLSMVTLMFNFSNPLGADPDFRKAAALAVNRNSIVKDREDFTANVELLPKHFWGRINRSERFDLEKARTLVSGLKNKYPSEFKEKMAIPTRLAENDYPSAQRLVAQLNAAGIPAVIEERKVKYWPKNDKKTIMTLVCIAMDDVDPLLEFAVFTKQSHFAPFVPVHDPAYDKLFLKASEAGSLPERVETVKDLSEYFLNQNLAIPLYENRPVTFFNAKKIKALGEQDGGASFFLDRLELTSRSN